MLKLFAHVEENKDCAITYIVDLLN